MGKFKKICSGILSVVMIVSMGTMSMGTASAATALTLNKTSITLGVGEQFDLNSNSSSSVYSSSNSSIASVKAAGGLITANKVGTTTITAKAGSRTATCKVTVKKAPTKISLNSTNLIIGIGETFDLNSSLPSGQGSYHIAYSSNNSMIASVVSAGGLVTAKSMGITTVTATTYNGKKVNCTVSVKPYFTGDIQPDGKIDDYDLFLLKTYVNGDTTAFEGGTGVWSKSDMLARADMNHDGKVNTTDYTLLQKAINSGSVIKSLPVTYSNVGTVRATVPTYGNVNYMPTNKGGYNPFKGSLNMYPQIHGRGSNKGNCTSYAWGRVCEIWGDSVAKKLSTGNAWTWYSKWIGSKSSTPLPGDVAVWSDGGAGHVAVVEAVYPDGSILISESGYNSYLFKTVKVTKANNYGYIGTFLGFIHPGNWNNLDGQA